MQKTLAIYLTKVFCCVIIYILVNMQVIAMNTNSAVLRSDEEYVLGLRRLYESYGYKKFKMRQFEKYDLYLENKTFLRNGNFITVTDPKGRLLALKPDVTLSIVKNVRAAELPEKLYYNETVYIADNAVGEIKETTQVGLEYIGELDIRALAEILLLAAESLSRADEEYRIAISHMGFVSEILEACGLCEKETVRISALIAQKNLHGLRAICDENSLNSDITERICGLVSVCGELGEVVHNAKKLVCGELSEASYNELVAISEIITEFGLSDKFILDFSIMNDMRYYNGILFQGFIHGVPKSVLSGGRYDNLVKRFGVNTSAAGFAVSTDLLDNFKYRNHEYDYDVFLQYSPDVNAVDVLSAERSIIASGERCVAFSSEPSGLKYKRKAIMYADGSIKYE